MGFPSCWFMPILSTSTRIAGAEYRMTPGAGHACCLEDPATFDANVLAFLEEHKFLIGKNRRYPL
jgi:pimeloyl-ACP methyl ester carboxylesterase